MSLEFHPLVQDAARALFQHVVSNPDDYPEDMRERILELVAPGRSPAFAVAETAEMIFARKSDLPNSVVKMGAELALTAQSNEINSFAEDGGKRGAGIVNALRRHSGEKAPAGMKWAPKEEDPMPNPIYVPPPARNEGTLAEAPKRVPPPEPHPSRTELEKAAEKEGEKS